MYLFEMLSISSESWWVGATNSRGRPWTGPVRTRSRRHTSGRPWWRLLHHRRGRKPSRWADVVCWLHYRANGTKMCMLVVRGDPGSGQTRTQTDQTDGRAELICRELMYCVLPELTHCSIVNIRRLWLKYWRRAKNIGLRCRLIFNSHPVI